jgi:hypothetical protein
MFGLSIPSLSGKNLPWIIGGVITGGVLYLATTATKTGFGPLDTAVKDVGELGHIEGVFINKKPGSWVHAPGQTTIIHNTPKAAGMNLPHLGGQGIGEYETGGPMMRFSGEGEFSSSHQGRLTVV